MRARACATPAAAAGCDRTLAQRELQFTRVEGTGEGSEASGGAEALPGSPHIDAARTGGRRPAAAPAADQDHRAREFVLCPVPGDCPMHDELMMPAC